MWECLESAGQTTTHILCRDAESCYKMGLVGFPIVLFISAALYSWPFGRCRRGGHLSFPLQYIFRRWREGIVAWCRWRRPPFVLWLGPPISPDHGRILMEGKRYSLFLFPSGLAAHFAIYALSAGLFAWKWYDFWVAVTIYVIVGVFVPLLIFVRLRQPVMEWVWPNWSPVYDDWFVAAVPSFCIGEYHGNFRCWPLAETKRSIFLYGNAFKHLLRLTYLPRPTSFSSAWRHGAGTQEAWLTVAMRDLPMQHNGKVDAESALIRWITYLSGPPLVTYILLWVVMAGHAHFKWSFDKNDIVFASTIWAFSTIIYLYGIVRYVNWWGTLRKTTVTWLRPLATRSQLPPVSPLAEHIPGRKWVVMAISSPTTGCSGLLLAALQNVS